MKIETNQDNLLRLPKTIVTTVLKKKKKRENSFVKICGNLFVTLPLYLIINNSCGNHYPGSVYNEPKVLLDISLSTGVLSNSLY